MNKKETSHFVKEQIKLFISNGGEIKICPTRKQNKSNTSFRPFATTTLAHRGHKVNALRQHGISSASNGGK